jgi:hypothetical protein
MARGGRERGRRGAKGEDEGGTNRTKCGCTRQINFDANEGIQGRTCSVIPDHYGCIVHHLHDALDAAEELAISICSTRGSRSA